MDIKNNDNPDIDFFKILNIQINDFIKMDIKGMAKANINYIFAKNGVGKTTYTRAVNKNVLEKNKQNIFIYNSDYVSKNIYIDKLNKNNQQKQSSFSETHKTNTFKIFFGHLLYSIQKEIKKLEDEIDSIDQKISDWINSPWEVKEINQLLETNRINDKKLKDIINITDWEALGDKEITNLKDKIKEVNSFENVKKQKEEINKIINKIQDINPLIDDLNKIINDIPKEQKDVIDVHNAGLKVGRDFKFNGNHVAIEELKKYTMEISSQKEQPTNKYNSFLKEVKEQFKSFLNFSIEKNFTSEINNFRVWFNSNLAFCEEHNLESTVVIKKIREIPELLKIESEEIIKDTLYSYVNKNFHKLKKNISDDISSKKDLTRRIRNKRKEKGEILEKQRESIGKRLNHFIEKLGLENFKVRFEPFNKKDSEGLCSIIVTSNHEIENLSEGEKKSFALAYFLTEFETRINEIIANNKKNLEEQIILIIDDPFDSNDHSKPKYFKNLEFKIKSSFNKEKSIKSLAMLKDKLKKDEKIEMKLVILTHNLLVLFALTSNIIDCNANKTELDLFETMKEDYDFEIFEWVKKDKGEIVCETKNVQSFFPWEKNMIEVFVKLFKKMISDKIDIGENDTKNTKIKIGEIKTLIYILVRLYDRVDNKIRGLFKTLIMNETWGSKYKTKKEDELRKVLLSLWEETKETKETKLSKEALDNFVSKLYESNINNYDLKHISVETFKQLKNNDNELSESLKQQFETMSNYTERISSIINKAIKDQNKDIFRIFRHKEYLSSTIVAFGIEEI